MSYPPSFANGSLNSGAVRMSPSIATTARKLSFWLSGMGARLATKALIPAKTK